jgi:hypothetical protein
MDRRFSGPQSLSGGGGGDKNAIIVPGRNLTQVVQPVASSLY